MALIARAKEKIDEECDTRENRYQTLIMPVGAWYGNFPKRNNYNIMIILFKKTKDKMD